MSSSLNLSPDLPLIGIQAGLFLTNMYVVKKLILEPYLRIKAAREGLTGGSQDEASNLLRQAGELDQTISEKMRDAHRSAALIRDQIKSSAMAERSQLITRTEQAAKKEQLEIQNAVATNLKEERAKREESIARITEEFVQHALQ